MENVFSTYHPAVAFVFLACALVFSMAAMQPVYVLISFAGAFATSCVTRGFGRTARSLLWIVPMWLIVTVANPLFSAMGSTEVFRFGLFAVYAESLFYGACSWTARFACATAVPATGSRTPLLSVSCTS